MILRRQFLVGAAATVAAPSVLRAQGAAYVLGTLFPMSGANAEFGTMYLNGVQLALDHIAADKMLKNGIDLRPIDSQGTAQGGAVGMTRLANVDRASYVLIGFTGVSKAAAPIGDRAKVVMVNGGGVGPDLATLSPYFWNILPLANQEVRAVLPFIKEKGFKRIAMIYTEDPSGMAVHAELKSGLPGVGGELVGAYGVAPTLTQFAAIAAQVRDVRPDAVFFASVSGVQAVQIVKQLRDNGISQQIMTYSTGNLPSVSALPESEGLVFTGQSADWAATEPTMKRFVTGWREKLKSEPTTYGLNYYNATLLFAQLAKGLEAAGKPVSGETLREEMLRVRTFQLAGGEVTFAENGTASTGVQLNQVRGGRIYKIA
ncbi:MAG: ABC transporter substrate-binding protein [Bosea sp.]|uniref:ABC transporter substrate-binding protein n=1 Tax=Bosea sp. (in: a-proteobacteria) TaxID=1871050 RepID=UPI0010FA36A8|nr:ABC transporter substrate-binding protein [Bosea sp. (in: a-proteobacteria)]MCP4734846.1 ABC transporter substrate-binding protein [Bosea sp. (in: a-proteobacteria)]